MIGAANGFLMSGSRVVYSLAKKGNLPFSDKLSYVNEKGSPVNSIILVGTLACLYSLTGKFDLLTDIAVFSCWIFYTLTFASVIVMRLKHPELKREYKVPLYPGIPLLAILSSCFVLISYACSSTVLAVLSIVGTLLGLAVYRNEKAEN